MIAPFTPYAIGANAAAEAMFSGRINECVTTLIEARRTGNAALHAGGKALLLETLSALRKAGADLGEGRDAQAADFLRSGNATIQAELLTATPEGLEWRLLAIGEAIATHRAWLKNATITETPPKPAATGPTPVQVVSMPDRVSVQSVERDKEGEITSTTTLQKDFA